ncbi:MULTISPECIES: hypothetical protein [Klebsiella]|uniref:hypothetical protein n=1 Tax=Klebsiella TaxID=570 RepID=UPI0021DA5CF4|nr:hypothetical protein [Klebsiella michiganensis]UYB54950.1 hypothetical protein N6B35_16575 [Klebsiella michiganensis]HBM3090837.1 hypothetical protein [Klebsiella michiganensis]HEC2095416.1 hypothetical protein [Klebsiella oxytoca]
MSQKDDIQTFPLAGLEVRQVKAYDALILTPQYLASPIDATIHQDKNFIVTRAVAIQLIEMLQNGVKQLDSASGSVPKSDQH